MLGNKRDRRYDDGDLVPTRAANLVVGCRTDPFQRPDTTLVTDRPIEARPVQRGDDARSGSLDLVWVGVASLHDPFRQAMCGEQKPGWFLVTCSRVEHRSYHPGQSLYKPRVGRIAADNPRWTFNPTVLCRRAPSGERRSRGRRRELRIERQANDL